MRVDQKLKPDQIGVAVPESLGKDSPGELCGEVNVRISPGKGKDILRLRAERNIEKSILNI